MLVLDPSSTCDNCRQVYTARRYPYALPCGHDICIGCCQGQSVVGCPFSCGQFRASHVQRLRTTVAPPKPQQIQPTQAPQPSKIQRLERELAEAVLVGMPSSVVSTVAKVHDWLNKTEDPCAEEHSVLIALSRTATHASGVSAYVSGSHEALVQKAEARAMLRGAKPQDIEARFEAVVGRLHAEQAETQRLRSELSGSRSRSTTQHSQPLTTNSQPRPLPIVESDTYYSNTRPDPHSYKSSSKADNRYVPAHPYPSPPASAGSDASYSDAEPPTVTRTRTRSMSKPPTTGPTSYFSARPASAMSRKVEEESSKRRRFQVRFTLSGHETS
jgi:hypothetical protein